MALCGLQADAGLEDRRLGVHLGLHQRLVDRVTRAAGRGKPDRRELLAAHKTEDGRFLVGRGVVMGLQQLHGDAVPGLLLGSVSEAFHDC